jgi:hypothetical protein
MWIQLMVAVEVPLKVVAEELPLLTRQQHLIVVTVPDVEMTTTTTENAP